MNRFSIHVFSLLCFLCTSLLLSAQEGRNPFDIENRLPTEEQAPSAENSNPGNPFEITPTEEEAVQESNPTEASTGNPFEVNTPSTVNPAPETTPSSNNPFEVQRQPTAPKTTTVPIASPSTHSAKKADGPIHIDKGFRFWISLILLILLALLLTLYRPVVIKVYRAFTNDNFLKLIHREQSGFIGLSYLLLYIFFFINAGAFILLSGAHFGYLETDSALHSMLYYTAWIAGIFIAKHLILSFLSAVFPISKDLRQYSFMIVIFSIIIGLMLVPFNILMAFAPVPLPSFAIYSALVCIVLAYLFRTFRGLFLASRYISLHKFHFFMYLCTVEIAPVLVLFKLVILKTGIQ